MTDKTKDNKTQNTDTEASSVVNALVIQPCPFCGGEASTNTLKTTCKQTIRLNGQDTFYGVNCIYCGVDNKGLLGFKTKEEAIENWNKRDNSEKQSEKFTVAYIAHPIRNDVEGNLKKIEEIGFKINAQEPDVIPFVPYHFDCHALNDKIPEERERGIKNNVALIKKGFIE